jgi:hypothetical protein
MDKPSFTPGPWVVSGISMDDGSISIAHPGYRIVIACVTNAASFGDFIASAATGRRDFGAPDVARTQWANARLIAAAPEMFEALRAMLANYGPPETLSDLEYPAQHPVTLARSALAKAEGRS